MAFRRYYFVLHSLNDRLKKVALTFGHSSFLAIFFSSKDNSYISILVCIGNVILNSLLTSIVLTCLVITVSCEDFLLFKFVSTERTSL